MPGFSFEGFRRSLSRRATRRRSEQTNAPQSSDVVQEQGLAHLATLPPAYIVPFGRPPRYEYPLPSYAAAQAMSIDAPPTYDETVAALRDDLAAVMDTLGTEMSRELRSEFEQRLPNAREVQGAGSFFSARRRNALNDQRAAGLARREALLRTYLAQYNRLSRLVRQEHMLLTANPAVNDDLLQALEQIRRLHSHYATQYLHQRAETTSS